jgi:hypothetical protein
MGRRSDWLRGVTQARPNERSQPQPQNAEVAAAVAALLLAPQPPSVPLVAAALLPALPGWILALPELAAEVAEEAAKAMLGTPLPAPPEPSDGTLVARAKLENLLLRAYYGLSAARRLAQAVRGPSDTSARERLRKALRAESSYLSAHQSARKRNLEAASRMDAAVERHGPVLGWFHGVAGQPADPRPNHVAADGASFDTRRGPPVSTGAWPSSLPGCTCRAGPPRAGARMLT